MAGKPIRIAILADGGKAQKEFKGVAKSAESSLDKVTKASKKAGKESERSFDGVKDGAQKAFSAIPKIASGITLPLLGAAGVLGAGFASAFTDALDMQDATAKLTASLGLSNKQSEKAGKLAGDLYKSAFGESIQEVNDVLGTVFQSGLASIGDSEDKIKGVAEQVFNYSKITGEEALPVTRAVSQMLKTGLAKNATQAFDILTKGQQLGINKSEDLLDTFNEYGTQFRKLGIDGPTALGLMNQAIRAGARDSDLAADAIKEFAIRAVDGSDLSKQAFKDLGLSSKTMMKTFAEGGPQATAALGTVLDKLRGVKDPVKQAEIAVALFGTQAEDLGKALFAIDPSTAVKSLGQLSGSAQRAGDVLNDTASTKLTSLGRTLKTSIADAITKYALPYLEKFADWFAGRGKLDLVTWGIDAAKAMVDFADKTLGALKSVLPTLAKVGAVALVSAAGLVALSNPNMAKGFLEQAKHMNDWADSTAEGIDKARQGLQGWSKQLDTAKTEVEFRADIEDLDQKIAKAQAELRDPGLTKERRATLTADIAQLTKNRDAALVKLNDPNLIKTRTAKLDADKRAAEQKIKENLAALANPKLTATKRAKLEAENAQLLRNVRDAQSKIDSLTGKTVQVNVTVNAKVNAANVRASVNRQLERIGYVEGRAVGGPVAGGNTYLVGEKGPEFVTFGASGYVSQSRLSMAALSQAGRASSGSGGDTVVYVEIDGEQLQGRITRTVRTENRNLKRKVRQG